MCNCKKREPIVVTPPVVTPEPTPVIEEKKD
jgi:hypothetical protein